MSHKLREAIPLGVRRERGAFFTSSDLRAAALVSWPSADVPSGPVLDPAVGAGDLLIEVAQRLPVFASLDATLDMWGAQLHGRDVEPSFVRLAKARLALLAISRGAVSTGGRQRQLDDLFPGIAAGDGLTVLNDGWDGGHIVMNPPFGYHRPEKAVQWANGRTNMAATFLATAIEHSKAGTCLTAILPEVIRTGSRYRRLREFISKRLRLVGVEPFGRFDAWTDVDVFTLRGVVSDGGVEECSGTIEWWQRTTGRRLGELLDISVGSVVPHRDEESGEEHPYLQARQIPLGGDYDASRAERRQFVSRLFEPPFVVVRRTSRPADRAGGSER
ncbi:MAG: N-6 DNA methylase [Chloroflexi bacterium]|nr:N-6 DNA methylase [Chloroflexota bacterium]